MKSAWKSILLSTLLLASITAKAETQAISSSIADPSFKKWSVEGLFNTISNSTTSTFGPSIMYAFSPRNQVGFRFLAPTGNSNSTGTASAVLLYRHNFSEAKTSLFGELSIAQNFYYSENTYYRNALMGGSYGTNIGIIHHITSDIAFGGIAGGEWAETYISNKDYYNRGGEFNVYARLGVFGAIAF
ncbi:hypothetical protein [Bdellovibrio sp. HCB337]|uniref:hypothetical protein n=1 Tax=Bdellovibrio sp. HCB337 TaxID=3394358 RepID=UPI0039A5C455